MQFEGQEYELLCMTVRPCFVYIEEEPEEDYWVDDQNAIYYYLEDDSDENPGIIEKSGKRHWLIQCIKPKGLKVTDDNEDQLKYIVYLGPKKDMNKEWDFDNHCPITKN